MPLLTVKMVKPHQNCKNGQASKLLVYNQNIKKCHPAYHSLSSSSCVSSASASAPSFSLLVDVSAKEFMDFLPGIDTQEFLEVRDIVASMEGIIEQVSVVRIRILKEKSVVKT